MSIRQHAESRQVVIGEMKPKMVKASLPKGESPDFLVEIGGCLDFARREVGWTVDQLSAELGKDSKQVARWMRGEERTQIDTVFRVPQLRAPFVIALSRLAVDDFEEETILRRRRK